TYRTSGATPNDLVGATFVLGGTLELNKTPGVDALRAAVTIGDNSPNTPATLKLDGNQQMVNLTKAGVGALGQTPTGTVTVSDNGTIDASAPAATANEQQFILLGAAATGNYQLAFGGYTTSFLPVTAADAQVQAALIALPSIG